MASASSSSARLLFNDSKKRLADRINVNTKNAASVAKQIVLGSKSTEVVTLYSCIAFTLADGKLISVDLDVDAD